ncbi:MAG: CARDB domain-containing protein [Candidatus Pacearchaeota archaeon]|jgi:hypothetical protein
MGWKAVLSYLIGLLLIALLVFYLIVPLNNIDFGSWSSSGNSNFSINSSVNTSMQFYPNLRYSYTNISYRIINCSIKRIDDMNTAFAAIQNVTSLQFYPVANNEQISVACDYGAQIAEGQPGYFIAGEGGPTNITESGMFNVINHGSILLLKDSNCPQPNIAIHELLHALGFNHSANPNNVMYPVSSCSQTIGQDIPDTLNQLYTYPSLPDLAFENISAVMNGPYLNMNFTVKNNGLIDAPAATVDVYADNNHVYNIQLNPLSIGEGRRIFVTSVFVLQKNVNQLKFVINSDFEELDKSNNEATLNYNNSN